VVRVFFLPPILIVGGPSSPSSPNPEPLPGFPGSGMEDLFFPPPAGALYSEVGASLFLPRLKDFSLLPKTFFRVFEQRPQTGKGSPF